MKRFSVFGLGVGLVLTACGDAAGPEGDRLSRAEALGLAAQVLVMSEGAISGSISTVEPGQVAGAAGAPVAITYTHESSHPCPSGGTLDIELLIEGTFDEEANSLQADLSGSHTHDACAFPHQGVTFTVDGNPAISFDASIGVVEDVPSQPFTFGLDGGFAWSASDGRAGSCSMELNAVTDFDAQERTLTGSICGHSFSETLTWS